MSKGSGFKIEMSQSGDPSVFEASNGKLSLSIPIKRRSGRQLITLPDKPMTPDHGTQILRLCNLHWPEVIADLLCWKPAKPNHSGRLQRKKVSTTATSAEWLT